MAGHIPLTLEIVCKQVNKGQMLEEFDEAVDFKKLVSSYCSERWPGYDVGAPGKFMAYDSVDVMCPGITGSFLDMVLEVLCLSV